MTQAFSGKLISIDSLSDAEAESIVIGAFEGDLYALSNVQKCELQEFNLKEGLEPLTNTSKKQYSQSFLDILQTISETDCDKIVLSRIKEIRGRFDLADTFSKLNQTYTDTFNYVFSSPILGTWMGASPEKLGSFENGTFETVALAGTKTEGEEWTDKEVQEQQFVTNGIVSILDKFSSNIISDGPQDQLAGPVVHLKTSIQASVEQFDFLRIVQQLHPTPATCGTPTEKAKEIIKSAEKHNRSLYTGFIGILGSNNSSFFVNLRCMQLKKDQAFLYLGGGITKDSELEKEWTETERKAKTLEKVLIK